MKIPGNESYTLHVSSMASGAENTHKYNDTAKIQQQQCYRRSLTKTPTPSEGDTVRKSNEQSARKVKTKEEIRADNMRLFNAVSTRIKAALETKNEQLKSVNQQQRPTSFYALYQMNKFERYKQLISTDEIAKKNCSKRKNILNDDSKTEDSDEIIVEAVIESENKKAKLSSESSSSEANKQQSQLLPPPPLSKAKQKPLETPKSTEPQSSQSTVELPKSTEAQSSKELPKSTEQSQKVESTIEESKPTVSKPVEPTEKQPKPVEIEHPKASKSESEPESKSSKQIVIKSESEDALVDSTSESIAAINLTKPTIGNVNRSTLRGDLSVELFDDEGDLKSVKLTWDLAFESDDGSYKMASEADNFASLLDDVKEYQIYGRQVINSTDLSSLNNWTLIGSVESTSSLPISCTLTDFVKGCTYQFSIMLKFNDDTLGSFSRPQKVTV